MGADLTLRRCTAQHRSLVCRESLVVGGQGAPQPRAHPARAVTDAPRSTAVLSQPARHSARVVAASLLKPLVRANDRLQAGGDERALHDVRVALRRLRTWLRAMRPVLDDTVRGRVHRRLRKLARLTGKARDLEVQLEWLEAELEKDPVPSPGRDELRKAWGADFSAAATKARAALDKGVKKVSAKLEGQLAHYRVDVRLDGRGKESSMAAVCGDLVTTYVERLRRALSVVHGPNDVSAAHAARIAG